MDAVCAVVINENDVIKLGLVVSMCVLKVEGAWWRLIFFKAGGKKLSLRSQNMEMFNHPICKDGFQYFIKQES